VPSCNKRPMIIAFLALPTYPETITISSTILWKMLELRNCWSLGQASNKDGLLRSFLPNDLVDDLSQDWMQCATHQLNNSRKWCNHIEVKVDTNKVLCKQTYIYNEIRSTTDKHLWSLQSKVLLLQLYVIKVTGGRSQAPWMDNILLYRNVHASVYIRSVANYDRSISHQMVA
jgi:hypothetical protein